jgi:hypothetical protein
MNKTYEVVTPEIADDNKKVIRIIQNVGVDVSSTQIKQRIQDRQEGIVQLQKAINEDTALLKTLETELNLDFTKVTAVDATDVIL